MTLYIGPLQQVNKAILINDDNGGYRVFLGADPENAITLANSCDMQQVADCGSFAARSVFRNVSLDGSC